jgi:iron complex transport system substrate-binding protein
VTPADLEEALSDWVGAPPTLLSLAPDNLDDVWADLRRVGAAVDAASEAEASVGRLQAGLAAVRVRSAARGWRPRVAAIEWIEPLMAAGNWVPELIDAAGGEALFAAPGQHSPWMEWEALAAADPDVIILMPCGYRIDQTLAEMGALRARPGWRDLAAVKAGRVFAVDGHHYFNRPGPRLVESAEILDRCVDARSTVCRPVGERWRLAAA